MIIISYIIGALLPIVALCMTTMVANNLKLKNVDNKHEDKVPLEIKEPNKEEINSQIEKLNNPTISPTINQQPHYRRLKSVDEI